MGDQRQKCVYYCEILMFQIIAINGNINNNKNYFCHTVIYIMQNWKNSNLEKCVSFILYLTSFFKFSVIIQVIFMSAITMFCIYILIKHHPSFLPIYRYICLIFHIFSRKIKCIGRVQSSTR